jgi:hypothetical protein
MDFNLSSYLSSPRRKPGSMVAVGSGFRRNDESLR